MANMSRSNMPKFDKAGNVILKKPEVINKVKELEKEYEEIVNGNGKWNGNGKKEEHRCQYCDSNWKSEISKFRHENWCKNNPNRRTSHTKKPKEVKEKPKKSKKVKAETKLRGRPKKMKENDIIKELKEFDKIFGLTDEQIAKYMRGKMK